MVEYSEITGPGETNRGLRLTFLVGIVSMLICGIVLTWIPVDRYFRPWEHAREGRVSFRPLARVEMTAVGELARNAGLPQFEQPRDVVFSTDEFGFRNRPWSGPARVVVIGDSFVAGSGVSDDETLTSVLSQRLGETVYNYGCADRTGPLAFLLDPRWRRQPPQIVVWAPAARVIDAIELMPSDKPSGEAASEGAEGRPREWNLLNASPAAWRKVCDRWERWIDERRENRLRRTAHAAFHQSYYRAVGRPSYETVIEFEGARRLALTLERQRLCLSPEEREIDRVVATIAQLHRNVSAIGARLLIAPMPGTGLIYPDRFSSEERSRVAKVSFLETLTDALALRGIEVIDVAGALRQQRKPYLFYDDDTHLNPIGLERVAAAIAPILKSRLLSGPTLNEPTVNGSSSSR